MVVTVFVCFMVHARIEVDPLYKMRTAINFSKKHVRLYFKYLYFWPYFDIVLTIQTIIWLVASETVNFSVPQLGIYTHAAHVLNNFSL